MDQLFRYEIDAKLAPFWLPFGVRPSRDGVTVSDRRFRATFGFLHIDTLLVNITGAHVTTNGTVALAQSGHRSELPRSQFGRANRPSRLITVRTNRPSEVAQVVQNRRAGSMQQCRS